MRREIFARGLNRFSKGWRIEAPPHHRLLPSPTVQRARSEPLQIKVNPFNFNRCGMVDRIVVSVSTDSIARPKPSDIVSYLLSHRFSNLNKRRCANVGHVLGEIRVRIGGYSACLSAGARKAYLYLGLCIQRLQKSREFSWYE